MLFQEKYQKKQFIFTYIVFICNGMLALSIGSLMPLISDTRGLSYEVCGMLVSLHSVGNFLSSFFAGALAEKIGRKRSILIFNSFFAISYLIILHDIGFTTYLCFFFIQIINFNGFSHLHFFFLSAPGKNSHAAKQKPYPADFSHNKRLLQHRECYT